MDGCGISGKLAKVFFWQVSYEEHLVKLFGWACWKQ